MSTIPFQPSQFLIDFHLAGFAYYESSTLNWTTPLRGCIVKLRK